MYKKQYSVYLLLILESWTEQRPLIRLVGMPLDGIYSVRRKWCHKLQRQQLGELQKGRLRNIPLPVGFMSIISLIPHHRFLGLLCIIIPITEKPGKVYKGIQLIHWVFELWSICLQWPTPCCRAWRRFRRLLSNISVTSSSDFFATHLSGYSNKHSFH